MSNKKPPMRHKVFGISDSLLDATRGILMGEKPKVEEPEEEADKKLALAEAEDVNSASAEKALKHDCANHVKSEQWGPGQCIPGMHTLEETSEEEGVVTHYDVMFEHGIEEDVPVEDLEIVSEKHHGHKKMKSMKEDDDDDDDNGDDKPKKKSKKSKKLDKVDPDELEGSHDERDDEDIDNDGDEDDSDKYLHKRRKAVHKAIKKDG